MDIDMIVIRRREMEIVRFLGEWAILWAVGMRVAAQKKGWPSR